MKGSKFVLFLIVSLALTAFLAGYIMVKKGTDSLNTKTGTILDKFSDVKTEGESTNLAAGDVKPLLIADRKVASLTNSADKSGVLYYEKNTGKIFEYNMHDQTEKVISNKNLPNFLSASWSPLKRGSINTYAAAQTTMFKYMDIFTGAETGFDKNIHSIAFSPDGGYIAYFYSDRTATASQPGKIVISQPDGQYQKKVIDTRLKDIELSWPMKDQIALKVGSSEIFLLTEAGGLKKLVDFKQDSDENWSPSGNKILLSYLADNEGGPSLNLSVLDVGSKKETPLTAVSVSASRCVWSIDELSIYCAVPKSPSVDEIYLINTASGTYKIVAEPNMQVKQIFLPALEDYMLLVGASDEKLYTIKISE